MHPGLKLTEWALYHPQASQDAKLVLAATLALPERDARQRQLADWLPINRDAVQTAQDELEALGLVTYRRPKPQRDDDGDIRMEDGKRIASVHPKAEPNRRHSSGRPHVIFLPGSFCEELPNGRGSSGKLAWLLAMIYVAEQAQSGQINLTDKTAKALLRDGTETRAVTRARKALLQAGAAQIVGKSGQMPVLRLRTPTGAAKTFDKAKAPTLHHWMRAGIHVVANERQWASLIGKTWVLPQSGIERVIELAAEWDGGVPEGRAHRASTLLEARGDVVIPTLDVGEDYPERGQETTSEGASSELLTPISSNPRLSADPSEEPTRREWDEFNEEQRRRAASKDTYRRTKRPLANVPRGFVVATDDEWRQITEALYSIEAKRDLEYRKDAERLALVPGMNGQKLLQALRRRFAHLVPAEKVKPGLDRKDRSQEIASLLAGLSQGDGSSEDDLY
jgi:hypothetical protein